jgi:hypothetical protein
MVPTFKIIVEADMRQIVRSLQRLTTTYELGLDLHEERTAAAVWCVSNCIITAMEFEENNTELRLQPPGLMPPNDRAGKTWNEIGQLFMEIGWISEFTPINIDDQSALLNRFFELVKFSESSSSSVPDGEAGSRLDIQRRHAKAYLTEHDIVAGKTPSERAELWLSSFNDGDLLELSELERGIAQVYRELSKERLEITDQRIALWLDINYGIRNARGEAYSRRWIREVRNRLIKRGFDLEL